MRISKTNEIRSIIGYGPSVIVLVDPQFGESAISNSPFNESFEVRLSQTDVIRFDYSSDYWNDTDLLGFITYQSNTDILPRGCTEYDQDTTIESWPPHSTVFIQAKNFSIETSWDKNQFQNECLESSFFTLRPVNTWWDTQSFQNESPFGRWHAMNDHSSLIIDKPIGHQYITEDNETRMMLFVVLNDTENLLLDNDEATFSTPLKIYSNPTNNSLHILHDGPEAYKRYEIYNVTGWGSTKGTL